MAQNSVIVDLDYTAFEKAKKKKGKKKQNPCFTFKVSSRLKVASHNNFWHHEIKEVERKPCSKEKLQARKNI